MYSRSLGKNLSIVDLETGGFKNLIASYVLTGNKTAVVETGPNSSIENLMHGLGELGVKPHDVTYVAITHVHIDHSGGVGILLKALPNARVIVHRKGAPHLIDPTKLWEATKETLGIAAKIMGKPKPISKDRIIVAYEGLTVDLGKGLKLKVIEAPGHAAHSVSYYEQSNEGVFPGDSAGAYFPDVDTVFPTRPPPFRPDIALISLDKLISLKPKKLFYSHFGEATDAVRRLRDYQVQINRWLNIVREGIKRGDSEEAIRQDVLTQDETIQKALPALWTNPVNQKALIENSVRGFIEFAKNPQI